MTDTQEKKIVDWYGDEISVRETIDNHGDRAIEVRITPKGAYTDPVTVDLTPADVKVLRKRLKRLLEIDS